MSLSDLQRNFFWILSELIGEVLKTGYYVSIWILWAKSVLWELHSCFCFFRTLSKRFLSICREFFGWVVKDEFWESMPYFSGQKFCLWKKYTCSGSFTYWAKKFRSFVENFSKGLRQLLSMCQEDLIYERHFFWKKNGMIFFFRPWVNCFCVLSKNCRRGCENCFLRAHTNVFFQIFS